MDDDQDNRPKPKLRWYNHLSLPNPRWFPAWLGVCVFVGAALSGACWLAMDRLGGQALAGFFAGGFVLCLVVLSFTALNAEETEKQMGSLTPPPWLSVSIVLERLHWRCVNGWPDCWQSSRTCLGPVTPSGCCWAAQAGLGCGCYGSAPTWPVRFGTIGK